MKTKLLFYTLSVVGFFFPYLMKFLMASPNESVKIFAIYSLSKFNLIYFGILILFFFAGLIKKFKFLQIAQIIYVTVYISYVLAGYFILSKIHVQNYIKEHNLDAKIVKLTDLKNYPNFKLFYKEGNYAAIKPLPQRKKQNPFNYKKDRAE